MSYVKDLSDPREWVRKEAERAIRSLSDTTRQGGVLRWKRNGSVPPEEMLELAQHVGVEFDLEASRRARQIDLDRFVAEYRSGATEPSEEERFEARAAHGPGVMLVNVLTGRRFTT